MLGILGALVALHCTSCFAISTQRCAGILVVCSSVRMVLEDVTACGFQKPYTAVEDPSSGRIVINGLYSYASRRPGRSNTSSNNRP